MQDQRAHVAKIIKQNHPSNPTHDIGNTELLNLFISSLVTAYCPSKLLFVFLKMFIEIELKYRWFVFCFFNLKDFISVSM